MTNSPQVIMQAILSLESKLDLSHPSWWHNNISLWPIYRNELARLLAKKEGYTDNTIAPSFIPNIIISILYIPVLAFKYFMANLGSKKKKNTCLIVIHTDEESQIRQHYRKLVEACENNGFFIIFLYKRALTLQNSFYWANVPMIFVIKLVAYLSASAHKSKHYQLCRQIEDQWDHQLCPMPILSHKRFHAISNAVFWLSSYYDKCIKKENVKLIFQSCYYDTAGYALNLSARRACIPCVDLQHGVAGVLNPAYGQWSLIPATGYHFLPKWFWCWHKSDQQAINDWSQSVKQFHDSLLGGYSCSHFKREYLSTMARDIKTRANSRKILLVSLQIDLTGNEDLSVLETLIREAGANQFFWLFRMHPRMKKIPSNFVRISHNLGSQNYDSEYSTALPLTELFSISDWHLTHSSATAIQAADFGLPSIIWSFAGKSYLQDQFCGNEAFFTNDPKKIQNLLTKPAPKLKPRLHDSSEKMLKIILQDAKLLRIAKHNDTLCQNNV